jgi:hypothetical protein
MGGLPTGAGATTKESRQTSGPGNSGATEVVDALPSAADLNLAVDHATVLHRDRLSNEVARPDGRVRADVPFRVIGRGSEGRRNSEWQSGNRGSKKQTFHGTVLSSD